jgi:hypothetical protein
MTGWTSDELIRIGTATELEIASRRRDGTLRRPRTIWVVRVGDDLYVRSMYGRAGGWFPDKYRRYGDQIIGSVVNPEARAATIKLVPR